MKKLLFLIIWLFSSTMFVFADIIPCDILPSQRPVKIKVGIYLYKIYDINTVDETFSIDGYLTYSWFDERLKFDTSIVKSNKLTYFNDRLDDLITDKIWFPHLEFINTSGNRETENRSLVVQSNGQVKYVERFHAVLKQQLKYHRFPFDKHELKIQIEPFSRSLDEIMFTEFNFGKASGVDTLQTVGWNIYETSSIVGYTEQASGRININIPTNTSEINKNSVVERFAHVECVMKVKRNPGFYIWQLIFPLAIIMLASTVILWIDDFATQIGVGFTLMLTIVAFNFFSESLLPALPYNTFIEILIMLGYLYMLLCIIAVVYINYLTKNNAEKARLFTKRFRIVYPVSMIVVTFFSTVFYFGNWIIQWFLLN